MSRKLSPQVLTELEGVISRLIPPGKGFLAADESVNTICKRFAALNIPCNEETRRQYRELLFSSPGIENYISGIILFEETLNQKTDQGQSLPELIKGKGIVLGIKLDKGLIPLAGSENENTTQGLDGLNERLLSYKKQGAEFTKWRVVYAISNNTPSWQLIQTNAEILARVARICQESSLVPIIEPEILIDGDYDLDTASRVSEMVLLSIFKALHLHHVSLENTILKTNMVVPGNQFKPQASVDAVAKATLTTFKRTVPAAIPTINFLSGGQTPLQATAHLNAMHLNQPPLPWNLSFSYARALQDACMATWQGKTSQVKPAQEAFIARAKLVSLAAQGQYSSQLEK